jgi:condensin-2 complex subunit G2
LISFCHLDFCFFLTSDIVMEHSSDATSAAVRSTALESITALLEIPQSHAVLRALLPLLGNLIHDKTEKVRLVAAKMLLKVKQVPGIRFYHVVPVTNIAAQMAEEGRLHPSPRTSVAKELTALMLNSYFPQGTKVQASDQIKRTMTFLMSEPEAAAVFYANLADQLDLEAVGKFVSMLLTCLGTSVKADQADEVKNTKGGQKRRRKGDVEDSEKKEKKALSASNTPLMASLAETICTLWSAVQGPIEKSENEELRDTILKSFEQVDLVSAIAHFEQKAMDNAGSTDDAMKTRDDCFRTCAALLRCAGKLPKDTIEGMVTHISDTLTSISKSELDYSRPHISAYFALLCLWDMTEEITSSVAESIDAAFKYGVGYSSPIFGEKRQSRGRGKTFNKPVVPVFSPSIVWGVVQDILQGNDPSTVIIRDSILASDKASETLQSALEKGIFTVQSILQSDSLGRTYDSSEVEFLLSVCEAYGRFALHKEAKNADGVSLSPQGHILLNWTSERVVPSFELTNGGESSLRDLDLSRISNASDSVMMPGSPGLASPPRRKADLKRTPNKPETSSVFDESADSLTEVGAFLAGAVANALLQSTNVIFSDWVAVGGTGTKEVSDAAIQWFNKIYTTSDEFLPKNTKVELLPSFCRLACQLGRFSNDFSLLQEIIAIYDEEEWSEESSTSIYKTIYTLLAIRSNESVKIQEGVVSTTLKAAEELAENSEEEDSFQIADFFSEVWIHKKGSILSALYAIVNNRQTCHCLAKKLVSDLGLFAEGLDSKTIFKAKCLSFLLTQSNYQADVEKIVRDIDLDRFTGGEIKDVMTQLLPSTAA